MEKLSEQASPLLIVFLRSKALAISIAVRLLLSKLQLTDSSQYTKYAFVVELLQYLHVYCLPPSSHLGFQKVCDCLSIPTKITSNRKTSSCKDVFGIPHITSTKYVMLYTLDASMRSARFHAEKSYTSC